MSQLRVPNIIRPMTILIVALFFISIIPILSAIPINFAHNYAIVAVPWLIAVAASGIFVTIKSPYFVWKILLWLVLFQEISLMILANYFGDPVTTVLNLSKDIFALSVLFVLLLNPSLRIRITFIDLLAFGFIGLNGLSFIFSFGKTSTFALAASFKQNVMPSFLFLIGRSLPISLRHQINVVRLLVKVGLIVAIFGLVERFILGDGFWLWLGIHELAKNEGVYDLFGLVRGSGIDRLPVIFYFMGDPSLRRLASIFGQPPVASYFLALPFVILLFVSPPYAYSKSKARIAILAIGASLALTIGRGGIIIGGLGLATNYLKRNILKFVGISLLFLILFLISSDARRVFSFDSIRNRHLKGLLNGVAIAQEEPLGRGLGSGGNYANWYGQRTEGGVVQESYVGALGFQLGIVGLSIYSLLYLLLFYQLYVRDDSKLPIFHRQFSQAIGTAVLGVFIASFFAEAAIGFLSTGFYMLCAGMALRNTLLPTHKKEVNFDG